MEKMIDLLVVGAGPAGLMAAKRAAELGLQVMVIEMKKDIGFVKRACSAQFVTDELYENETIKFEENKIVFTKNGFSVDYTGPLLNITDNYHHSPGGHIVHFAHKDHRPFSVKFDKQHLVQDLYKACKDLGVELRENTIAIKGKDMGTHVSVDVKCNKIPSNIIAKKLIIAEGVNAKLTGVFGLNKERHFYGMPVVVSYTMANTTGFAPNSWNQFYGKELHPFAEVLVESSLDNTVEITITGTKDFKPDAIMEKIINDSPLSHHFTNAHIVEKRGCAVKSFDSLRKPYLGNVVSIGDSAAHIEVITQGAIMCGYHAANAVKDEIEGKNGFEEYTKWWNEAFDFNHTNPSEFVSLYGKLSMMKYSNEELDYLFSLVEDDLICGNFSQFDVPKNIWSEILNYKEKIQNEKPELYEKIKGIEELKEQGQLLKSQLKNDF
ncbi:MAG: NAD(P)/FAD-dependent oxidoreductase [Clostridium butyricum]|nr:NAD(P)/FAD-dependent oxidoreductase [Clostridium butyricum]